MAAGGLKTDDVDADVTIHASTFADGTERPQIVLAEHSRSIVGLSTSAEVGPPYGDRAFTLVQRKGTASGAVPTYRPSVIGKVE